MTLTLQRFLTATAALLALIALGTLGSGPLGWRLGWWPYGTAFQSLMPWAANIGIAAAVTSGLALLASLFGNGRGKWLALASLTAAAFAVYMPWQASNMRGVYPRTNDISTDTANPPAFVATLPLRKTDGGSDGRYSAEAATIQAKSYADIIPLKSALPPDEVFKRAAAAAAAMPGWQLISSDSAAGRIEASQASRWFAFTDDVVVRISPDGLGSRIDVRSASRHGRGDFGVNAKRVRAYLAALSLRLK